MKPFFKHLLSAVLIAAMAVATFAFVGCNEDPAPEHVPVEAVLLDQDSMTLDIDEEKTLTAIVDLEATNREVTWSSSDPTVATATAEGTDKAKIKGLKVGSTTITVTTKDGGKTATCAVTVKAATVLSVSSDSVGLSGTVYEDANTLSFLSDGTYSVTAKYLGSVDVAYSSTYTVTDGVLNVPNPGPDTEVASMGITVSLFPTATVVGDTVKFVVLFKNVADAAAAPAPLAEFILSKADAEKINVTVGEPIVNVPVTGVTLSNSTVELVSGTKLDLSTVVNVQPANATNTAYTTALKDGTNTGLAIFVDSGNYIGLKAGSAVIVVTTTDGNHTAELTVNVTIPERNAAWGTSYFDAETVFTGEFDLSALLGQPAGTLVQHQCYKFKADGTFEYGVIENGNFTLSSLGYYELIDNNGTQSIHFKAFNINDAEESTCAITTEDTTMTFTRQTLLGNIVFNQEQ